MNTKQILLVLGAVAALAGCSSSDSTSTPNTPADNSTAAVFASDANGDPVNIGDPDALAADLTAVFGAANAEPLAIQPGDSIDDLRKRASGG